MTTSETTTERETYRNLTEKKIPEKKELDASLTMQLEKINQNWIGERTKSQKVLRQGQTMHTKQAISK